MPSVIGTSASVTGRESIILDPSDITSERVELDITPWVRQEGPDWGDAEIAAAVAEMQTGEVPVDFRIPNRRITIPLQLMDRSSMTYTEVRTAIQQKVGLFQRQGGWVKRDTVAGPIYADVVNASLKLGGSSMQSLHGIDKDAQIVLECLPDWYEDEITLTPDFGSDGEVIGVLLEDGEPAIIRGDSPARVRIEIENLDAVDRDMLLWAFRSRYYDNAATAALAYEAEDLDTGTARAGAFGGEVVATTLPGTPGISAELIAGTFTHVGSYRLWARVVVDDGVVSFLPEWRVGDGTWTQNERVSVATALGTPYEIIDLGALRLDKATFGSHEWDLRISATSDTASADVSIDKLWLQPLDEAAGELRATVLLWSSRHAILDTFGMYQEGGASAGVYGPVSHVLGDLPRLPPSGMEQRPVEFFAVLGVPGADFSAQVHYRPCWLFAPGG